MATIKTTTDGVVRKVGCHVRLSSRFASIGSLVLLLAGCRQTGDPTAALADRLEKLPALPADVAATLDPKTNATKLSGPPPVPVKATGALPLAPCCSIKEKKNLKVSVPLTKCAPLRDFIMAPIQDLVMARDATGSGGGPGGGGAGGGGASGGATSSIFGGIHVTPARLGPVSRTDPWNTVVCMTSNGPWDALFIEDRNCNNYSPQDSLLVSGWGGLVPYYWNGGPANHPPGITVVSCNDIGTFRLPCGISTCQCDSAPCPANQPCPCPAPW